MTEYVACNNQFVIPLGRQGDNLTTEIKFPVVCWEEEFGAGAFELIVQRPAETAMYPVLIRRDGEFIVWAVRNSDVSNAGKGKCQISLVIDGAVKKSIIFATSILPSIEGGGSVPEPYLDWVDEVISSRDRAEKAAETAVHPPYPNSDTGTWWVWDEESEQYVDSGESYAGGSVLSVNGKIGSVELNAEDIGSYTKEETDEAIASETSRATEKEEELESAISSEEERATAEEGRIDSALDAEISRSTAADEQNAEDIEAEVGRATNAENQLSSAISDEAERATAAEEALDEAKVDKETGKGLSTNDYTTAEKTKLAGIASGAEVNVQSDYNQTDTASDDYIKNKPDLSVYALEEDLTEEISRATAAESQNASAITAETTRATAKELDLQATLSSVSASLSSEIIRALAKEEELETLIEETSGDVAAEKTRAETAESGLADDVASEVTRATNAEEEIQADIDAHEAKTDNPHSVTKSQVGLGNVDNTSDANKPVSTATQTALNQKANTSALTAETTRATNAENLKENLSNKVPEFQTTPDDTHYPTEKLVKDNVDRIDTELTSQSSRIEHLDEIKADRAVLAFLDRRAEYIYKHNQHQEFNIEAIPTAAGGHDPKTEAYSRELFSGVQGVIPKTFGGKTRAVNQHTPNGNFDGTTGWSGASSASVISASGNVLTVANSSGDPTFISTNVIPIVLGHHYFVTYWFMADKNCKAVCALDRLSLNQNKVQETNATANTWTKIESFCEPNTQRDSNGYRLSGYGVQGGTIQVKEFYNVDLTQWFGAGAEPSDVNDPRMDEVKKYLAQNPPYNAGQLRSADVSQVSSNTKNLWGGMKFAEDLRDRGGGTIDTVNKTVTRVASVNQTVKLLDYDFKENTRYTIILKSTSGTSSNMRIWYTDGTYVTIPTLTVGSKKAYVSENNKTIDSIRTFYYSGTTYYAYEECGLFEGVLTENDFRPYGAMSLIRIPTQLRNFLKQHGYGLSAGSLYNKVDFLNKNYNELLKTVNLGSLTSWGGGTNSIFHNISGLPSDFPSRVYVRALSTTPVWKEPIICSSYQPHDHLLGHTSTSMLDYDILLGCSDYTQQPKAILIKDPSHTTAPTSSDNWLDGVYLNYPLETPNYYYDPTSPLLAANGGSIVPDLIMTSAETVIPSDKHHIQLWASLFPDADDLPLLAESGGTVTFEQAPPDEGVALELPVPNTLDYLVNVPQAAGNL